MNVPTLKIHSVRDFPAAFNDTREGNAAENPSETCLKELLLQRPFTGTEDGTAHDHYSVADVCDLILMD